MKSGVIAVDHGSKRTGFAVADALRITTAPLDVWEGPGDAPELVEHIAKLCDERDVDTFVVGMPFNMDGTEGPRAADVRSFCTRLAERFPGVSVIPWDERLTTKEAESLLREAGIAPKDRKGARDAWSALVILRDWMESGEPDG
jgi:putative Holliday junction resolvase